MATTSTRESVMLSDILRHLRRPSTLKHEQQQDNYPVSCHVSAWMVALQEERGRRLVGGRARRALLGSADEVLLGPKRLDAQSAMADISLAVMAGVTAAEHERISKFCLDHLRVWA